ncbi:MULTISPECIES: DUF3617 domain-containing protein [Ralstonia solanacearum species complex]|uniref:DUF3617 domain-containing protein n=1 Tax=Ralstonia solanacearum TaxID=305 RepID=A0AAD0S8E9_RALSL|nr:DUF3617 domain-containing protein [Ralstonia solanacearum]BEU73624.1 hypothetical protein MAFF211271_31790 [Ralstonia pseudosolanacearum]AXV78395.1 DUF3617 domain-containing protein [Ralstonia solanacearum]AXV83006.1 DUF3617 domain-containing protein [Ralstonia solanacearum]AXV92419.1 DUF3617 domain-containing protein [Ralstonia solanacearum]AXW20476.1 DUF3617 domain-containing protein [Ralstonia solanacearum]
MKLWWSGMLLAGLAVGAQAQEMTPGLWEGQTSFSVNGKPVAIPDEQGRQRASVTHTDCLTPKDAADVRSAFERSFARDMPGCRITRWSHVLGTLKVAVSCDGTHTGGVGTMEASGPLSATRFDISGASRFQHPQFGPMTSGFRYQGRYLGACKS